MWVYDRPLHLGRGDSTGADDNPPGASACDLCTCNWCEVGAPDRHPWAVPLAGLVIVMLQGARCHVPGYRREQDVVWRRGRCSQKSGRKPGTFVLSFQAET